MNIRNAIGGFGQRVRTGLDSFVRNAPAYFQRGKQEYSKNLDQVRNFTTGAHRVARGLAPEFTGRIDSAKSRADKILDKGYEFNRRLNNTQLF